MIFKYPLRINGHKYPEVIAKLEEVKQKEGIALYIRQLIERDVKGAVKSAPYINNEVAATHEIAEAPQPSFRQPLEKVFDYEIPQLEEDDDTDFGGGLA